MRLTGRHRIVRAREKRDELPGFMSLASARPRLCGRDPRRGSAAVAGPAPDPEPTTLPSTMTRSLHLTLPFLLAPLVACSASPSSALTEADLASIRATDAAWIELATAGNFSSLVKRCYVEDAMLLPPNGPVAKGRAAIEASLRTWPPMQDLVIQADEVVGGGDMAYGRGMYSTTFLPKGGAPIAEKGKFLVIWRKDHDGEWRMARDSFSSDLPVVGQ